MDNSLIPSAFVLVGGDGGGMVQTDIDSPQSWLAPPPAYDETAPRTSKYSRTRPVAPTREVSMVISHASQSHDPPNSVRNLNIMPHARSSGFVRKFMAKTSRSAFALQERSQSNIVKGSTSPIPSPARSLLSNEIRPTAPPLRPQPDSATIAETILMAPHNPIAVDDELISSSGITTPTFIYDGAQRDGSMPATPLLPARTDSIMTVFQETKRLPNIPNLEYGQYGGHELSDNRNQSLVAFPRADNVKRQRLVVGPRPQKFS
ncbi:hypothetical protein OBBRIDRAFT_211047 [Obba rivulosa]|uniref:Uncharacterized protein n=1 Tax=Obba rivulosa TaxID=1052685 RepID=A0A8E2AWG9_9APHY|nr:hypothetical protein OBBRIDRAFT_211047 [Obba rivulosa]